MRPRNKPVDAVYYPTGLSDALVDRTIHLGAGARDQPKITVLIDVDEHGTVIGLEVVGLRTHLGLTLPEDPVSR